MQKNHCDRNGEPDENDNDFEVNYSTSYCLSCKFSLIADNPSKFEFLVHREENLNKETYSDKALLKILVKAMA